MIRKWYLPTTFNLPDLRGEFIRGWDNGRGGDTGRVFGSAQEGTEAQLFGSFPVNDDGYYNASATRAASTATAAIETYAHARVHPRNIALLPCIKT